MRFADEDSDNMEVEWEGSADPSLESNLTAHGVTCHHCLAMFGHMVSARVSRGRQPTPERTPSAVLVHHRASEQLEALGF